MAWTDADRAACKVRIDALVRRLEAIQNEGSEINSWVDGLTVICSDEASHIDGSAFTDDERVKFRDRLMAESAKAAGVASDE